MFHIPQNRQYALLREFIRENRDSKGSLIKILHKAQELFGYLPPEVQIFISRETGIPLSKIWGVVTFYNFFRTEPIGKHIVNVCLGTACHVRGAKEVLEAICEELNVKVGGTSSDGFYTVSTARCFGACGLAPVMMIDDRVYGRLSPQKAKQILREFRELEEMKKEA